MHRLWRKEAIRNKSLSLLGYPTALNRFSKGLGLGLLKLGFLGLGLLGLDLLGLGFRVRQLQLLGFRVGQVRQATDSCV